MPIPAILSPIPTFGKGSFKYLREKENIKNNNPNIMSAIVKNFICKCN